MNVERPLLRSVFDDGIYYPLFAEAEAVRWSMAELPFAEVRRGDVSPAWIAVARETLIGELTTFSATERFFADFGGDVDFTQWLTVWLYEETKHPSALVRWLDVFGEKFDSGFMLQGRQTLPFMPSHMGTLATNIISEMVAAALYLTLAAQPGAEPVLREICRRIGGDEARHAASFFRYAGRRLQRAADPTQDQIDALKILYFWITPELNARVGHPVNLLAGRYQTDPLLREAVPPEEIHRAIAGAHRRACRVFGALLALELREPGDVVAQLDALEG